MSWYGVSIFFIWHWKLLPPLRNSRHLFMQLLFSLLHIPGRHHSKLYCKANDLRLGFDFCQAEISPVDSWTKTVEAGPIQLCLFKFYFTTASIFHNVSSYYIVSIYFLHINNYWKYFYRLTLFQIWCELFEVSKYSNFTVEHVFICELSKINKIPETYWWIVNLQIFLCAQAYLQERKFQQKLPFVSKVLRLTPS